MISINPPPTDRCCERCGKHVKDLKPFGKTGDPLVGDFNGALLVKTFRSMATEVKNESFRKIEKESAKNNYEDFEDKLVKVFGEEKTSQLLFQEQLASTVSASWECRDCIIKE